jgi:Ca2+-binding EF-hand superfamily protein
LSHDTASAIQEQFQKMDENGDGCITPGEFMRGMREAGMGTPEIETAWEAMDTD